MQRYKSAAFFDIYNHLGYYKSQINHYITKIVENCIDKSGSFVYTHIITKSNSYISVDIPTKNGYDFVGWTGLVPISIFFEFVLGIQADVPNNKIVWHINKLEKINGYIVGNPGSISIPKENTKNSFMVIEDSCITVYSLENEILHRLEI